MGKFLTSLMLRLLEMQASRCAVCTSKLTTDTHFDDIPYPVVMKIDRERRYGYKNCVVLCRRCAGSSSAYDGLIDYYERRDEPKRIREIPDPDPAVIEAIDAALKACGIYHFRIPENFGRAPMDRVSSIVAAIKRQEPWMRPDAISERNKRKTAQKIWMAGSGARRRFSEAQNHRCCYCHARLNTDTPYPSDPYYPTWEHVERRADGGGNHKRNVVIACATCNSLRDAMELDAYAFYDWVQQHPEKIIEMAEKRRKGNAIKLKTRGYSDNPKNVRKGKLFK